MTPARTIASVAIAISLAQALAAQQPAIPTDSEIRRILEERVESRQSVGIVVGVIDSRGRRIVTYGSLAAGDSRPLTGDTVFEIGSVTKVFTGLLLADMVERGEVDLDDPVATYLPAGARIPERFDRQITLQDLATHTSGLPRMPTNVDPQDPANPFADYSASRLFDFLSTYRLTREVASEFEYSNLGGALLGHALAGRAGVDFSTLVETRIAAPLGLKSTRTELTAEMRSRLAVGHAYALEPTANWEMGALAGAGALRSTANDLLTFLAAHLDYAQTRLAPAMAAMLKTRRRSSSGEVALAWFVEKHGGVEIISHGGNTGGYRSFIGYNPQSRVGVVVLSNAGTGAGVDDIGLHLLNPRVSLLDSRQLAPPRPRMEVPVAPGILESYIGQYRFPSSQAATVSAEDGHLVLRADGEVKIAFYAESPQDFFAKIMDAQIRFEKDTDGHVTGLVFHRDGFDHRVRRTD